MTTKTNNVAINKLLFLLWGIAFLTLLFVIGIFGWNAFYGFVIPQAQSVATLSLAGIIGFSLVAGVLSFFAPCPFAVFPAYAALFLSSSAKTQKSQRSKTVSLRGLDRLATSGYRQTLYFALTASFGVVGFYVILGAVLAFFGTQLAFYTSYLKLAVIALIFLLGTVLFTGKQLPTGILDQWTNLLFPRFKGWGAFGYGVVYAIAGAACFLPVILTIALIPILSGKFLSGLVAFFSYGLAISLMLTLATFILASGRQKLLQALIGKAAAIKKLSGTILIASALFLGAFYVITGM